jgi:hypothetical protein
LGVPGSPQWSWRSAVRRPLVQFLETVAYGRENGSASRQSVMPAFGGAIDVMENIDDIYSCLKARADGVVGRGRPERCRSSKGGA